MYLNIRRYPFVLGATTNMNVEGQGMNISVFKFATFGRGGTRTLIHQMWVHCQLLKILLTKNCELLIK